MMQRALVVLVFLLSQGFSASAQSSPSQILLEQLPKPANTQLVQIAGETVHNNWPMSMATFQSEQALADVIAFYKDHWHAMESTHTQPAFIEQIAGEWTILGVLQNHHSVVLQLAQVAGQRTSGYVSVLPLASMRDGRSGLNGLNGRSAETDRTTLLQGNTFASGVFADSQQWSKTQTVNRHSRSDLRVFSTRQSVSAASKYFIDRLSDREWIALWRSQDSHQAVSILNKENRRLELMFVASEGATEGVSTLIIANEISQ